MKRLRPIIEPIEAQAFIASAMGEFMSEVRLAELALVRGNSESVRAIATYLFDDCNRVLLDIARVATRKNLPLPSSLGQGHENLVEQLRAKTGADFDSAYIERMALHHRHAIKLFKRGQTIKIPEISALASRVLALIEARVKLSRQLTGNIDSLLNGGDSATPGSAADDGQSGL